MSETAYYVRASTDKQSKQHQINEIEEFLSEEFDAKIKDCEMYADYGVSGSKSDRDGYQRLLSDIESGRISNLVAWELSRITRDGEDLQQFLNLCEENDVHIYFTHDNISELPPDGQNRFIADVIGAVYQQERRSLIRRVEAGTRRAREEGKWLGQVPKGFRRVDGFLEPVLDADVEEGETSFFDVVWALERLEDGASYRSVAEDVPNCTRQTLATIDQSDDRRSWYLDGSAADERVAEAIEEVEEV